MVKKKKKNTTGATIQFGQKSNKKNRLNHLRTMLLMFLLLMHINTIVTRSLISIKLLIIITIELY